MAITRKYKTDSEELGTTVEGTVTVPSVSEAKAKSRRPTPHAHTTTLAVSGLGATDEDIEIARAAGMYVPTNVKRLHLLLYGPPGTGKTLNAHMLPNTRTLDLDGGMQSVEWGIRKGIIKKHPSEIVYKTILQPPRNQRSTFVVDECADTVDAWLADEDIPPEEWNQPYPQFWDTLIIDGGTGLTDTVTIKALAENSRLGISKSWEKLKDDLSVTPMMIQDWGSASSLFQKFINNCRVIGKNVVLVCHEYVDTDDSGIVNSYDPLVIGQLRQKLPKDFDEVWYAHVKGKADKPEFLFQINPDSKHRLRSRTGCLDPVEPADFNAIRRKIAKFYNTPEDRIWKAYHGTAGADLAASEMAQEAGASI